MHADVLRERGRQPAATEEVEQEQGTTGRQPEGQRADVPDCRVGDLTGQVVEAVADDIGVDAASAARNDVPRLVYLREIDGAGDAVDGSAAEELMVHAEAVRAGSVRLELIHERIARHDRAHVETAEVDRAGREQRAVAVRVSRKQTRELDVELLLRALAVAVAAPVPVPARADEPRCLRARGRRRIHRRQAGR